MDAITFILIDTHSRLNSSVRLTTKNYSSNFVRKSNISNIFYIKFVDFKRVSTYLLCKEYSFIHKRFIHAPGYIFMYTFIYTDEINRFSKKQVELCNVIWGNMDRVV